MVKHPAAPVKHKHYRPAGKKKEGNAARYVTRSQAVKQLQVSLPLFRKLCILKGVFPREPKKKVKGNHHTYYHLKDVSFIQHEPLLERLREIRAYERKVKKADAKKNKERAALLKERRPTYKLDRIILQRYPKFVDALRDVDDCLTMVHLFAALPAIEDRIDVKRIHNCRRLSHEWQAYISWTHKLRKVFVSVKGIYYQAEAKGKKVRCLSLLSSADSLNCNHLFCNTCTVKSMKSGSICPVYKIPYRRKGTGKTTLSTDHNRYLIGFDEHCWSNNSVKH